MCGDNHGLVDEEMGLWPSNVRACQKKKEKQPRERSRGKRAPRASAVSAPTQHLVREVFNRRSLKGRRTKEETIYPTARSRGVVEHGLNPTLLSPTTGIILVEWEGKSLEGKRGKNRTTKGGDSDSTT